MERPFKDLTRLWCKIKADAKRRGLIVEITIEEAFELFEQQHQRCAVSGQKIVIAKSYKQHRRGVTTASLDRIVSSLRYYTMGNVQWVHKDINQMKWNFDQDYFIETCKEIARYHA